MTNVAVDGPSAGIDLSLRALRVHGLEDPQVPDLSMRSRYGSPSYSYFRRFDRYQAAALAAVIDHSRAKSVLEVGCARGQMVRRVSKRGVFTVGVDINRFSLAEVEGGCPSAADAAALPFPAGSFEVVFAAHLIEHVADLRVVLEEMLRVTKPGGSILLAYPVEPVRGLFAAWSSMRLFGTPFNGRAIHVRRVDESMIAECLKPHAIGGLRTAFSLRPWPQRFTSFQRL